MNESPLSLATQLEAVTAKLLVSFPEEVRLLFARKTEELVKADLVARARRVGDAVTDFSLPTTTGDSVQLKRQLEAGPLVLSFYRGTWCPYCSVEFEALARSSREASAANASVLAVSSQGEDRYPTEGRASNFYDAIDGGNALAREFGLVYDLGERMTQVYRRFGIDLTTLQGTDSFELAMPASYVVDQSGVIRYAFVNPDYTQRAEPGEILDVVRGLAA